MRLISLSKPLTSNGFSLIEVLIAIVISAVGMLGIAATQSLSVTHTRNSVYRTTATILASQISDSMRVNMEGKSFYIFDDLSELKAFPSCFDLNANCSPENLARFELFIWKQDLNSLLPEAQAKIINKVESGTPNPDIFVVEISWQERTTKEENVQGFKVFSHMIEVYP